MPGQQQVIDHVEREQRLHGIIRETLARLSETEEAETLGMAKEGAIVPIDLLEVRRGVGNAHDCALPLAAIVAR